MDIATLYAQISDQEHNEIDFGYRLPTPKQRGWVIYQCCGRSVCNQRSIVNRTLRKRGEYWCSPCRAKSPQGKAQRSKQSKQAWANPEYVSNQSKILGAIANSEDGRAQRSKQAKQAWEDPDFREFQQDRITKMFQSDQHKQLVSERNKADYKADPDKYFREKVSVMHTPEARANHDLAIQNPEYKKIHSELAKERFKNPEYRAKIAAGIEAFSRSGRQSKPEKVVSDVLDLLEIKYTREKSVGPYNFDLYLSDFNIYIEVQGDYWHNLPNNQRRDVAKSAYLRIANPDSLLLCIEEHETLIPDLVQDKIQSVIGVSESKITEFEFNQLIVKPIEHSEGNRFLRAWHYAQCGRKAKFMFGAYLDGQLIAVAKFAPVVRKEVSTSVGLTPKTVSELDRLCIRTDCHKPNFGSWFLARSAKHFWDQFPETKAIVSFADTTVGHEGIVYQASNWEHVSTTKPDYVYVDTTGWMMHKKTLYNHAVGCHMTEKEFAESKGYVKVFGKEKKKFVLFRQ